LTNVSEVRTASITITLMMDAACTSETPVSLNLTAWRYIPEDSKLHICCRENLKSHIFVVSLMTLSQLRLYSVK
jgi:hypothetical protein